MSVFLAVSLFAALSAADLERIATYDDVRQQRRAEVVAEARMAFAGRGPEVAETFLTHGEYPPSGGAYAFVLQALGDVEATLILIRALPDPPKLQSGVVAKYGMGRDFGEIRYVIEAVLENDDVRRNPRIIAALVDAIATAKARPKGIGLGAAGAAVSLLGKCRGGEVIRTLQTFAKDPEAAIRYVAVQSLGEMDVAPEESEQLRVSTVETLAQTLRGDPDIHARVQAATSLGNLAMPAAIEPLRAVLEAETNPLVIDAIVAALEALQSPLTEVASCRKVVGRCWEPASCTRLFECWRGSVSREAVIEAATTGPPLLRAFALRSLVKVPEPPRLQRFRLVERVPPPPPGPAPGSRRIGVSPPVSTEPAASPAEFDAAARDRLLTSAVEVLSHPVSAFPGIGTAISHGTAQMVRDALWEISGRQMPVALRYADRVVPAHGRYTSTGRYAVSHDLFLKDPAGYVTYRRPRQFLAALLVGLPFTVLLLHRRTRHAAVLLLIGILGWGIWSLFMKSVRELPPPPLAFLTLSCIAFFAAAFVSALLALLANTWSRFRMLGWTPGRGGLATAGAGALAFGVCGWSRWNHFFPIGGEGWELIFDPLGSAILAAVIAILLSMVDMLLSWRWRPDTLSFDPGR